MAGAAAICVGDICDGETMIGATVCVTGAGAGKVGESEGSVVAGAASPHAYNPIITVNAEVMRKLLREEKGPLIKRQARDRNEAVRVWESAPLLAG